MLQRLLYYYFSLHKNYEFFFGHILDALHYDKNDVLIKVRMIEGTKSVSIYKILDTDS
jgi:hypothetical protein